MGQFVVFKSFLLILEFAKRPGILNSKAVRLKTDSDGNQKCFYHSILTLKQADSENLD